MVVRTEQLRVHEIAMGAKSASGRKPGGSTGFLTRLRRSELGQSVVEFAMVLPFLGAIAFALLSLGKAVFYYIELTHVANEGARIAAVSQTSLPNGVNLRSYLCSQLGTELRKGTRSAGKAKVIVSTNTANVGDPVTVSVSTVYHVPLYGDLPVVGSATMRVENPVSTASQLVMVGGDCT